MLLLGLFSVKLWCCRLMMPGDERLAFVQAVVPDIKTTSSSEDPTDLLFPELNMELLEVLRCCCC